jgi:hypothetical protein
MKIKSVLTLMFLWGLMSVACSKDDYDELIPPRQYSDSLDCSQPNVVASLTITSINWFAGNSKSNQSAAASGDYLVLIPKSRSAIHLYNLKKKELLYTLQMNPGTGKDAWGDDLYHSNQATFGVDFYYPDDAFPLLYISQRAKSDKRCFLEVYRLIPSKQPEDEDYTTMEAELVQTIYFPTLTHNNSLGNVNCAIDNKKRLMYTYSRNNNSGEDNTGECKISCFKIPYLYDKTVMLEDSDILDSWMLGCKAINMQGGCIKDDILYIGQGYKSVGYIYLNIVDLKNRFLSKRIDLLDIGITWEPEGSFTYNGNLMIASGANIWEIVIQPSTLTKSPKQAELLY